MSTKIVMDSAGDLKTLEGVDFACVPLKIVTDTREFVDDGTTDVEKMIDFLLQYKGKASTACPSVGDYLDAFGSGETIYCITITSSLSGSYNAAAIAAETYKEQHPDRNIHVFDSLSTGSEMVLLAEFIRDLVLQGKEFSRVVEEGQAYLKNSRLVFSLESLHNLANNGRVPGALAKVIGILGMRLIGVASDAGTLQPTGKARGEKKVVPELVKKMLDMGYNGGKMVVGHCRNEAAAGALCRAIREKFPNAVQSCHPTGALCSFYAEAGGLLVGFETGNGSIMDTEQRKKP
ncbi:MAG: DegV family protein [Faecousia sp.]